ncbi:MAG: LamG domain-containing protein [Verrucomicrobiota bacterium]
MKEEEKWELERLCERFFEESLSDEGKARLEEILLESDEARRIYLRQSSLRSSLRHYASETQSAAESDEDEVASASIKGTRVVYFEILKWAASISVAFFLGALVWNGNLDTKSLVAQPEEAEATYEGVAVMILSHEAQWPEGDRVYENGDSIPAGRFRMAGGSAQLEFYSGATVVLEGVVDLELISEERAYCFEGRATVSVSAHAKGFTIETPGIEFVDHGAEFGLDVRPGEPVELHAFSGEVEVYEIERTEKDDPFKVLTTGSAAQFASARDYVQIDLDTSYRTVRYLAMREELTRRNRFLAWETMSRSLAEREDVVGYFPFYETDSWIRDLENTAQRKSREGSGAIVGCLWEEGRWPQKSALRFNNPSDRVRFNFPGAFDAVTFAAWIKVESLKNRYNGLFMTDTFEPGNTHWQIEDTGRLILGVRRFPQKETGEFQFVLFSEPIVTPDVYGKWIHVASTYDVAASEIKHYLNGELVASLQSEGWADSKVIVGPGEIGNWGLSREETRKVRNFDGSIDELLFCSSVLSQREIKGIYRRGEIKAASRVAPLVASNRR